MTDRQLPTPAPDYDVDAIAKPRSEVFGYIRRSIYVLAIAAIAYFSWEMYHRQVSDHDLLQAQDKQQQQLSQQLQAVQQQLVQLQQARDEFSKQLAAALEQDQLRREEVHVLEAERLVHLASQELQLQRDVNGAIKAMQKADERLRHSDQPAVIKVRKALSEDLQALRNVPSVDTVGISLALSTLNKEVDRLPLQTPDPKSHEQQTAAAEPAKHNVNSWSELPRAVWDDLKSLIVIRNHEEPVKALLAPEQRFFLTENLRLQIEQARLALLSGEADVYKERLSTAMGWLERYFDKNAKPTQAALETLKHIQKENIAPNMPELTRSYQAIQRFMQREKSVQ